MEREIKDLKQQVTYLTEDIDRKNTTIRLLEQDKIVQEQDVLALADELDQIRRQNKDIEELNANQNQVIRSLEA